MSHQKLLPLAFSHKKTIDGSTAINRFLIF